MQIEIDNGSGFCFGVTTAIRKAEEELAKGSTLYCLGDIVHNGMECERLKQLGLITIDHEQMAQLHDVKVLLRAHGEPPETYELARRNNIEIIDATCPVVLQLQKKIKRQYEAGVPSIVIFGKPGIKKTVTPIGDDEDPRLFKYEIFIAGLEEDSITITDSFNKNLLEVATGTDVPYEHMRIFGGTQNSQIYGKIPVSYADTDDGIVITVSNVPKQENGLYYGYYRIDYYLRLKDGVDLMALAIANGGEYDLVNTAVWSDHETQSTYKVVYDYLDKKLLNEGALGGTSRTAQYKITFNAAKATLNNGEPMTMTDVLSSNLSLNYSSVLITTDPAGASVPYSISGGTAGTTVATYIIPDSTKVVIEYEAEVRGNGPLTITNKVSINGYDEEIISEKEYGVADEGEGAQASFKIVKVDGYDANKKLSGVRFKVFG